MSSVEEENEPQSNNMEQEIKVEVEEVTINLGCVKKELEEEDSEFIENRYKPALTFDNIFGDSWKEQRDNRDSLIGFLDDKLIMETGTIKFEDIKEEENLIREIIEQFDCNQCGGNYERYCPDCSSISHILNNLTPNIKPEPILNTAPINIFEIREVSGRQAVVALKTLPKGIILGPFEGVAPIDSTTGPQWKIKDKKLVNDQNGNWMKYIGSVASYASKNLDVFQIDEILYFETSREIQEGEELLVCYGVEEEVLKSNKDHEFYLVPVKKEKYPKVFACTLCCLGFRLEKCLVEHKTKCPQAGRGGSSEDFEIVQCRCKLWLEKREHLESHKRHCLKSCNRLNNRLPDHLRTNTNGGIQGSNEIWTPIDVDASYSTQTEKNHTKFVYGIDCKTLKKRNFHEKHMRGTYFNTSEKKNKINETNHKAHFNGYLDAHNDVKPVQCDICNRGFSQKCHLKRHLKNIHQDTSEKDYKCSHCSYQTNYKHHLRQHLNTHSGDVLSFQCEICKKTFNYKSSLYAHVKDKHSNISEKKYKCSKCTYQTNFKGSFKAHLNTHTDIKPFQCDVCEMKFSRKANMKLHRKNKHSNTSKKEYKCSECPFQTNHKTSLKCHLNTHNGIKRFRCDFCEKKYTQKGNLMTHIKCHHLSTNDKEYQCSECSYQTSNKYHFTRHLNIHTESNGF